MAIGCHLKSHRKHWFCGLCMKHVGKGWPPTMYRSIVQLTLICAVIIAVSAVILGLSDRSEVALIMSLVALYLFWQCFKRRDWFKVL